jgi:hypothetical protein
MTRLSAGASEKVALPLLRFQSVARIRGNQLNTSMRVMK